MATDTVPARKIFDEWIKSQPKSRHAQLERSRDRLLLLFRTPRRNDLIWWYDIGVCVLKIFPPEDKHYGDRFMELLANLVKPERDPAKKTIVTELYQCREFARKCDREEARQLAAKVRQKVISRQHVAYLITVDEEDNTKTRDTFLDECVWYGWSTHELQREIQDDRRPGLTRFGGRRPRARTTSNPAIAARDIVVQARAWIARHDQYFGAPDSPLRKLRRPYTDTHLKQLEAALEMLGEVAKLSVKAHKMLESLLRRARAGK